MSYNNMGSDFEEDDADLSGLAGWIYQTRPATQEQYDSGAGNYTPAPSRLPQVHTSAAEYRSMQNYFTGNQQVRRQGPGVYGPMPTPNTQPPPPPLPPLTVDPRRTYATVASEDRRIRSHVDPRQSTPANRSYAHEAKRPQQYSAQFEAVPNPRFQFQAQLDRNRSWAQIAAAGTADQSLRQHRTVPPNQILHSGQAMLPRGVYHGAIDPTQSRHPTSSQQNVHRGQLPMPYNNDPRLNQPRTNFAFGNGQANVTVSDTWMLDLESDFNLYDDPNDDPLTRFIGQKDPYVATGSLVVDTSASLPPSQLLRSPADSIDTSSVTSSSRRKKREIMEGGSGQFKCQHCGGGFHSMDDRRHHEYRVHLPYAARPLSCSQCGDRFIFQKDLKRHLPKHGNRAAHAEFFCHYTGCKYSIDGFARKDHYTRHLATHSKADSAIQMSRSPSARTYS